MQLWKAVCDFDGTISTHDVTDDLLMRFAKPGWEALEDAWRAGQIGSRECMTGQIQFLDASKQELDKALDAMSIDPMFTRFAETASSMGIDLLVASDGLDYAIKRILGNHGLEHLKIVANHLEPIGERGWRMTSPNSAETCRSRSGTCKCAFVDATTRLNMSIGSTCKTLLIGDGQSDFCVSERVDFVFAKDRLISHCLDRKISHHAISGFGDAIALLPELLAGRFETPAFLSSLTPQPRVDYV